MIKRCSICQKKYAEFGNNAWPVNDGRCCNSCNWSIVIQARLERAGILKNMAKNDEK